MVGSARGKLGISVLYAEDEALTRKVFCEVLATKVDAVHQAANGREGLELFRKFRPHVVLIDNNMPEMDGIALAKEVQAIAPATPIMIVSGGMKRRTLVQMEQMKISYFKKPLRIREVLAFLERVASNDPRPSALPPGPSLDAKGVEAWVAPAQPATR